MNDQLYINGEDAYLTYGVTMGESFISNLDTPLALKEYIKNEMRNANGTQYVTSAPPKVASREVTLNFYIQADTETEYRANRDAFLAVLMRGAVNLFVPVLNETYRLLYTGKNVTYGLDLSRSFAKIGAKFIEPDPTNRNNIQ